jgi:phage baseplate assembly protein W
VANITITSLKKAPKTTQGFTYSDLKLDLAFDYTRNNELLKQKEIRDIVNSYDYDAIKNSIISIFTTIPGQKILNPFFGLNLVQYLFEPVNEITAKNIAADIEYGINTFEPRITLRNIEVAYSEERQIYNILLLFTLPQINNKSFELVGTLSNSGFFLNN